MLVAVNVCKAAAAAVVGTLAIASGRNMVQTRHLCRQPSPPSSARGFLMRSEKELQSMSREELLEVFLHECEAPTDLRQVEGDWNGRLLCNNGLTRVTRFITNGLFGRGREWNGKSFAAATERGCNRFERFRNQRDSSQQWTVTMTTEEDHPFRVSISPTSDFDQQPTLRLEYCHDPTKNSLLWRSMVDEVRILNSNVLIGMGKMAWSGGAWNAAPFCLYRRPPSTRGF